MKKKVIFPIMVVITLVLAVFLIRLFSARQLDDVSPGISCDKDLLDKADIYYVIPKFNNISIDESKGWCQEILDLNKTLALHGIYHTYKEFLQDKTQQEIEEAINIFHDCFNKSPEEFKPPQLAISKNNKILIKRCMNLDGFLNQIFHKVYHCSNRGILPNWLIDLF